MAESSQEALQSRVLARMKELSSSESRWHRSLWTVATTTSLDELAEAARYTWSGVLSSEHALSDFKVHAIRAVGGDPGVGTATVRNCIVAQLKRVTGSGDAKSHGALARIEEYRVRVEKDYLRNWASYIEAGKLTDETVELAARSIVTQVQSRGYSRDHIHAWLQSRGRNREVHELAREAAQHLRGERREFVFRVASDRLGKVAEKEGALNVLRYSSPAEMFRAAENATEFDCSAVTDRRAIEIKIRAADPFAALRALEIRLDAMLTRLALSDGKAPGIICPLVLEANSQKIWKLRSRNDLLSIPGLRDWGLITSLETRDSSGELLAALQLLAPHLQATHGVSLAILWATCESLLGRAREGGHHVAKRLAAILTAAYPRHLAYDLWRRARVLKDRGVQMNCRTAGKGSFALRNFCEDIADGNPGFTEVADLAAFYRYSSVLRAPVETLKRVSGYLESIFLRVYYHRNFVMHSAKTDAVSLGATSDIAPVLVAAALNELISAIAKDTTPVALSERAAIELELLGTDAEKSLIRLLS